MPPSLRLRKLALGLRQPLGLRKLPFGLRRIALGLRKPMFGLR